MTTGSIKIKLVKWGKKKLADVPVDLSKPVTDFKTTLYQLTGVPLDRQKIMAKGVWKGTLKDNMSFSEMAKPLSASSKVTLIGTSAGIPKPPSEAVKFVEDMSSAEVAKAGVGLPAGLQNLGNTCYMNSTLQCLRAVPELREGLRSYAPTSAAPSSRLCAALRDLFQEMDNSTSENPAVPAMFVRLLRQNFPQFDERGQTGVHKQQDADELLNSILQSVCKRELKQPAGMESLDGESNLIDALFGIRLTETLTCSEEEKEPVKDKSEVVHKLICNIEGTANAKASGRKVEAVDHLHQGVLMGFEGAVELRSERLGRNAQWISRKRVDRLPRYICFQFMRFFWKTQAAGVDVNTTAGGLKCKIMRTVKFPQKLDMFNMCSKRLQGVLKVTRDAHRDALMALMESKSEQARKANAAEEEKAKKERQERLRGGGSGKNDVAPPAAPAKEGGDSMDIDNDDDAALQAALAMSMEVDSKVETDPNKAATAAGTAGAAGIGLPAGFQGYYEPFALVTHKGRSADGGHYIGWTRTKDKWVSGNGKKKKGKDNEKWICFDDDDVEACPGDHIYSMNGGGDLDMAYLIFYRYIDGCP